MEAECAKNESVKDGVTKPNLFSAGPETGLASNFIITRWGNYF